MQLGNFRFEFGILFDQRPVGSFQFLKQIGFFFYSWVAPMIAIFTYATHLFLCFTNISGVGRSVLFVAQHSGVVDCLIEVRVAFAGQ